MIPCNKCSKILTDPTDLIHHIKNVHQIRNDYYTCSLCNSSFDELYRFRMHVEKCFRKKAKNERIQNVFLRKVNEDHKIYQDLSDEAALDFGCKLASNMNVPRNAVFDVIDDTEQLITSIVEAMRDVVLPWVKEEKIHDFENIISVMNKCLENVNTEHKLDKCLLAKKLISFVKKVPVGKQSIDPLIDPDEEVVDPLMDIDDGDDGDCDFNKLKTVSLMPINFQIKSFFELPHVYEKFQSNVDNIKKEGKLNHFINGTLWKSKLEQFNKEDVVIPYHLHIDDTQTNNPLGTHTTNGDQTCVYYSFPTMPNEYNSRLENIFTALVFESSLSEELGNEVCYDELIKELNKLADEGIVLNINGKEQKVYFVLGLLLGDNKGVNHCLGYPRGFTARHYCRLCRMQRIKMKYSYVEDPSHMRNIENYYQDLAVGNMTKTGICENSVFNNVRYFHATQTCVDIMHDINEGVLPYNLCEVILYFIEHNYFTLAMLNKEKHSVKYSELEENNRSGTITLKSLLTKKLKMNASESHSFAHHLPFILLNIIDKNKLEQLENNEVWRFLLITIRFLDMCYMPSFDSESIEKLRDIIANMNEMYVRLFNKTLKPKHHYATHYPELIKKCGPLRYMSSMRYEANHKFVKNYTKNTISRRNISYSLCLKLQYNFAYILKKGDACKDNVNVSKPRLTRIVDEDFFRSIVPSNELKSIFQRNIYVFDKIKLNGLTLSSKLYLPFMDVAGDGVTLQLLKIVKLFMLSESDPTSIRIICKKYVDVQYNSLYASYSVTNLRPEMHIINISDVLQQRLFPVALHRGNGSNLFRFRTF